MFSKKIKMNYNSVKCALYDYQASSKVRMGEKKRPLRASKNTLLCEVKAAGVNPVDAKYVFGDKFGESWMPLFARYVSGMTPGFDFSGVVLDAPSDSGYEIGDEVYGLGADPLTFVFGHFHGSLAEVVAAPLNQVAKKPKELSHIEAAALPLVSTTVLQASSQHNLRKGQRILIIGASGGVGHVATQVASYYGAHVTAVSSEKNIDFVRKCGATTIVNYSEGKVFDQLHQITENDGLFDLVFDCVHSVESQDMIPAYHERISQMVPPIVKQEGSEVDKHNYVVFGGTTKHWFLAGLKRITGWNLFPKGFELFWINMPKAAPHLTQMHDIVKSGLRPNIAVVLPFDDKGIQTAFEMLRSRRTVGKIVIDVE